MKGAMALIVGTVGVALLWGAVTNRNPLSELQVALAGKSTTKSKGFKSPTGKSTATRSATVTA